jgi:hypothetical protein
MILLISISQLLFSQIVTNNGTGGNAQVENGDNAITGPINIKLRYGNRLPSKNYHKRN